MLCEQQCIQIHKPIEVVCNITQVSSDVVPTNYCKDLQGTQVKKNKKQSKVKSKKVKMGKVKKRKEKKVKRKK